MDTMMSMVGQMCMAPVQLILNLMKTVF